ncbi:hypothetical protein SAMN05192534_105145 [Alteribacillus persepolensis]|uniref:Uncharacterized protein n=1 Tax=Alteribacillus persepolensis TaxID=568899 RepID=A0A1G8CCY4_9BACI|nr:hypothetical protein [Alteribacillus persepolensis]SDH43371.1 hypothetical protein SAMN05192534_105145 [Alteribacillus persepolensis]
MEKQTYYVNLNPISMDDVSPVRIPDSTLIQYEIEATPEELENLRFLLNETQDHDIEASNLFSFEHFDESITETDQHEYQRGMDKVFDTIYELGTPETKKLIKEIHLQNHEPKKNMRPRQQ